MSYSFFFHSHNTNQSSPIMTATKNLLSLLTLLTIIHVRSPLYFKAGVEFELVGQKLTVNLCFLKEEESHLKSSC